MKIGNKRILITGGLGFIGFNAALYFAKTNKVLVIDDFSRLESNALVAQLELAGVKFARVDLSHIRALREAWISFNPEIIIHLAGQTAVTLSILNPMRDFSSNTVGTLNLLELSRQQEVKPIFLFASTNKVYGDLNIPVTLSNGRYVYKDAHGIDENFPLSFKTPYGCSKGAADQYVLDYYFTYQVPTVVFRQSCVYGPHQYGIEDQGWVAWFAYCALTKNPVNVYGDGAQVRDVLFVDDILSLYEQAIINIDKACGQVFNIGGGAKHTLSINELIKKLEVYTSKKMPVHYDAWRPSDQKVFICDISKAQRLLGWQPKISIDDGLVKLCAWIKEEKETLMRMHQERTIGRRIDVSVVIPAHNEQDSLPAVLEELQHFIIGNAYNIEVILVDDHSTDNTVAIAGKYSFVRIVHNQGKGGKGAALRAGFKEAKGTYIAMMDADFSHNAHHLADMIEEVRRHQGLVIASRILGGSDEYTRVRAFGNIVLTFLFGFFHGRYLSDALNGFKIFHRDVFNKFEYTSNTYEIEIELLANTLRLHRPITEVSGHERSRLGGVAKSSVIKHGTLFLSRIIQERFRKVEEK